MENKSRIKIGIYGIGILMMGVIGISGALTAIGAHFPDASQTMIQNLISIPCLVVIPVTLIVGKLMDSVSKKLLSIIGILCFLIGGFLPALMSSLTVILVLRGILGIGIGIVQCVSSALVAENFEGPERDKVQGNLNFRADAGYLCHGIRRRLAGGYFLEFRILCTSSRNYFTRSLYRVHSECETVRG